jgi:hypothetical protein
MVTLLRTLNGYEFKIAGKKREFTEVKSPEQSKENKDKASSSSHSQKKKSQINRRPL